MSRSKTPAIAVAVILCALIVLPVLILMVTRGGDEPKPRGGGGSPGAGASSTADFDLRQLADRAESLLEGELAEALRDGDVSLDFIAGLNRSAGKAREAMDGGKNERAKALFRETIAAAEAELEAVALAEKARAMNETVYDKLSSLEYLKATFAQTYEEAVETYNSALRQLNAGRFEESVDGFEMASAILGDLEARAVQRIGGLLDAGDAALAAYELEEARGAYASVLAIDPDDDAAQSGLAKVRALEGIAEEVRAIQEDEETGRFEEALAQLEELRKRHPNNEFLADRRAVIEKKIRDREYEAALAAAESAERADDLDGAIASLEEALSLKQSVDVEERLDALKARRKAARLESLLSEGYEALSAGRFEAARDAYREAVELAPESKEARDGNEKASSLYLANIRYRQNLSSARRYIREGRYPLAAKFFNEAMAARPSPLPSSAAGEEAELRRTLEAQSKEVPVTIRSDNRTFVSIIGVLPPGKLRTEELKLYPDVYTVRGQRSGFKDVEIEFKVDANQPNQQVEVVADERL